MSSTILFKFFPFGFLFGFFYIYPWIYLEKFLSPNGFLFFGPPGYPQPSIGGVRILNEWPNVIHGRGR